MSEVKVQRILGSEHDNQKWIVLEGFIEGCPQVTKRRSINTAALVSGGLSLAEEKAKLIADVQEYYERLQSVNEALKDL